MFSPDFIKTPSTEFEEKNVIRTLLFYQNPIGIVRCEKTTAIRRCSLQVKKLSIIVFIEISIDVIFLLQYL